jgi:hypothetical protein
VTEAEWLAATDPDKLLEFVRPSASERKLRLFAACCCRRVWDWMWPGCRRAIEVLESRADQAATEEELAQAASGAAADWLESFGSHIPSSAAYYATGYCSTVRDPCPVLESARTAASEVALAVSVDASHGRAVSLGYGSPRRQYPVSEEDAVVCQQVLDEAHDREREAQCQILRDIFHGPCRPILLRRAWLYPGGNTVLRLTKTIYREQAFDLLPVLADALEDAGCDDLQLLNHCRSGREHYRGCWLIDGLLGKW